MINTDTGEITIGNIILGPGHSRDDFLASNLYKDFLLSEQHGKHHLYILKPQKLEEYFFLAKLYFDERGIITEITLGLLIDGRLRDWKDWSLENEVESKNLQDQWLLKIIGPPHRMNQWYARYEYKWGSIESSFNERDGSGIKILYTKPDNDY